MANDLMVIGDLAIDIEQEIARSAKLKSEHTRRTYAGVLRLFNEWRQGRPITGLLVEEYAAHLLDQGLAPATINHKLSAIRWLVRRLARHFAEMPHLDKETRAEIIERAKAVTEVEGVTGKRPLKGRHVPAGEVRALLEACENDGDNIGVRDGAMIAVAHAAGLRRSELVGLDLADVTRTAENEIELRIDGKGDKVRFVTINEGAEVWLSDWLAIRGGDPGPVWYTVRKGGKVIPGRIGVESAQDRLDVRAEQAGVAPLTWHDFRRTLAGDLLDDGADLPSVQKIMGHENSTTTAAYDRRPIAAQRKALRRRHTPRPRSRS